MIQCTHCGTQNRDGSKFCSDCGARLVQQSGLVCPMCSTPNTVENVFCSKCGARLVPLTVAPAAEKAPPPTPIKGLSLPAKPAEPTAPAAKAEPVKPAPVEQSDDWLARLRAKTPEEETASPAPAPETPAPARKPAPPAEEPSDWLARLRAAPPVEEATPTAPTPPVEENAPTAPTPPVEEATPTAPTPPHADEIEVVEEDLPDWLRTTPAPIAPEPAPTPTDETPSWMTRLRAEEEHAIPTPAPTSADEIPDWLKGGSAASAREPAAPTVEESTRFEPVTPALPASPPVPATEAEIPDWLKSLNPKEEESAAPVAPVASVDDARGSTASPGEELLESLEATAPTPPPEVEEPAWLTETPREVSEEEYLPDWLRTPVAGEPQPVSAVSEAAPAGEPIEVPDWIAALEPTEQPAPGVFESGPAETSGPLAGLRGVLPLATAIIEPHAPPKPAPPSPFRETARLFESILAAPALAPAAPTAPPVRRAWTMRPLVYFLMVLAILIPFFVPDLATASLRTFGTPAADFYDAVQSLQPNSIVILSFDYEPGNTGEMDLQANAIARHLMGQHAKIIAMSTTETGAQIAQRVLDTAARDKPEYKYGINYVNLYLPGYEAGLNLLATNGFGNAKDWNQKQTLDKFAGFSGVRTLQNVQLIIELAGAPEPLQRWMEQVQQRAGVKIAAGVSAAVEPRARAYRDAKQLTGFVSGLIGAAQYEVLSKQRGLAVISAGAQSAAQIVLIGLIVLGNLVFWFTRGQGKAK